jgi:DNA mismatch endonuclease (patch repair protein)
MADVVDKATRSRMMAGIRGTGTLPEQLVRSYLFRQSFRFRKNVPGLPGRPDIVLPKYNAVVFVHGCFWHGHPRCKFAVVPKSNVAFWKEKLASNRERDRRNRRNLRTLGWRVFTIWECQLDERRLARLAENISTEK